jgi:hypothetical protein
MKKLMIGAAVAAITVGAFAATCSETTTECAAWDLKFNLKTLTPKKTNCGKDACGESLGSVYYLDNTSRKIEGYMWACEYDCEESDEYFVTLWDKKNKKAVVAYSADAQAVPVPVDDLLVYGKKANKVAGTFVFEGLVDDVGDEAFNMTAAAVNGKFQKGDKCYIKSLSGYAAGKVKLYLPTVKAAGGSKGTLCEDPVEPEPCEDVLLRAATFCGACCWETWCDEEYDYGETLVPAAGTWSMKYNKKVSKGTKSMSALVPQYAL